MLQKTKDRLDRRDRKTWIGLYTRIAPTKKTKLERADKKYKVKDYG